MPQRRLILLSEVERQCRFALTGYDEATAAMAAHDAERFWHSLEAILAAAGQLHGLAPAAGLALADDSPLNTAELGHAAEVDSWRPPRGEIAPSNFGPGGFTLAHPGECARFFDLDTSIFILFGHIFEMPPLLAEIAELEHRAETELEHAAALK
jgi:hypothetical protein